MSESPKQRRNWLALAEATNDQLLAKYVDQLNGEDDEYIQLFLRTMKYVTGGGFDATNVNAPSSRCVLELAMIGAVTVVKQLTLRSDEGFYDDDAAF